METGDQERNAIKQTKTSKMEHNHKTYSGSEEYKP